MKNFLLVAGGCLLGVAVTKGCQRILTERKCRKLKRAIDAVDKEFRMIRLGGYPDDMLLGAPGRRMPEIRVEKYGNGGVLKW